ncbi:two-component SAPR family response regulator [Paenibacillus endophyticus]|uniref:Two-component SAPR family response regulator n=1 Tax=Paenibacillus endophyticus TaxID=1294268 RepID=A0A7W5C7Z2_9BACL|nr:response regulator [Paenibacillus endophyticus]MBB3152821.1 two-component SAPR family response regulator [Paenibacillus endophyticus]
MKVLLIDDEKAMHLIMKRMLGKIAEVEIVGVFQETESAFSYLNHYEVDLVFLDISMPRENGVEFAERIRESGRQTKIVFITSHKEYAVFAFDVDAFDYIVKPVVQERLQKTVQKALAEKRSERLLQSIRKPDEEAATLLCLGGIDIQSVNGVRVKWKSSKSAELMGYLLLHKGRLVSRSKIIEDLFGGMAQKNAETYLNTTVYQLRKVLEAYGLKENLHSESNHYAFSLSQVHVDFLSFEEGCRLLATINESNIQQAIELEQQYTGHLFGERAFPWAWNEVERLTLMYNAFTQRLSIALMQVGEINTSIRLLLKLMTQNEIDEESFMLLMKAWALQENKEAIVKNYAQFVEVLHREIGIKPSSEASDLYSQLLLGLKS